MPPDFDPNSLSHTESEIRTRNRQTRTKSTKNRRNESLSDVLFNEQKRGSQQIQEISRKFKESPKEYLPPPYSLDELAALMESNSTHFACVMAKASAISSMGWRLIPGVNFKAIHGEIARLTNLEEMNPDEEEKLSGLLEQIGHLEFQKEVLAQFFDHPNEDETFKEINLRTDIDDQSLGNAYWEIVRTFGGKPTEIYHLPAISVRLMANGLGFAQIRTSSNPMGAFVLPHTSALGPTVVYFKKFGSPWIMDWRTGEINGVFIPNDMVNDFINENRDDEGNVRFKKVEFPEGMNPAIDGYSAVWVMKDGIPLVIDEEFFASEVIWFKKYSVRNGDGYGVPDIISALSAVTGDKFAHRHQLDFFDNSSVPAKLLHVKGFPVGDPNEEQPIEDRLTDFFDNELRGEGNAHKTVVIASEGDKELRDGTKISGGEVTVESLAEPMTDAGWINYLHNNRDEIIRAERVPPEMIASFDQTSRPSATGVSIPLEIFKSFVIHPEQASREARINRIIKEGFGYDWKFEFLQIDTLDQLREMEIAKGYYSIHSFTVNEIRAKLNMDAVPGGDRMFIITPMGVIFLDEIEKMSTQDTAQTPDKPLSPDDQGSPNGRGNKSIPSDGSQEKEAPAKNSANAYGLPPQLQRLLLDNLWIKR